jgi:hypothetical protein
MATLDMSALNTAVKAALSELGVTDPMNVRAFIILQLWKQRCPECAPTGPFEVPGYFSQGNAAYYTLKALVEGIEKGTDVACGCYPYFVTQEIFDQACQALAQVQRIPGAPRCGYGWAYFNPDGTPFVVPPPVIGPSTPTCPPGSGLVYDAAQGGCVCPEGLIYDGATCVPPEQSDDIPTPPAPVAAPQQMPILPFIAGLAAIAGAAYLLVKESKRKP